MKPCQGVGKISITLVLITSLIFGIWIYVGFPQIWQKPPIPPEIEKTQAAAGDLILLWDGADPPTGWTCISCLSGDPYYQVYPRGAATYGAATSGAATHTHTVSYATCTEPSITGGYDDAGGTADYPSATHIHNTITSQTVDSVSNDPLYRSLKIIRYTGMPATLPAGVIGIFDTTSLPANWSAYSLQDTYFLKGDGVVATSGTSTHTHDVSVTTGGPDTTEVAYAGKKGGESPTHTHTGSGTSASADHQPPYLEVVFAKANVDTSIPEGLIALFDVAPPTNWTLVSGAAQPFNGRFLKGNSTAYGATGGSETHTHANLAITLPATADTIATADVAPAEVGADIGHTHTFTVSFSTDSHLPVYRDTVFAKYTPPAVSCTTPLTETAFGTIDNTAVFTSSPNATTTASITNATGLTMKIYDVGGPDATGTPSLYKSTAPTDNIGSADASYADTATLVAGTEGYGIQATTTGPNLNIDPRFLWTGNNVGGLEASSTYAVTLASSSAAVADEVVTIIHKAAASATNVAGDYSDNTITITCTVNP